MIRSVVFALALLPALAMAQDVPPCPDFSTVQPSGCMTTCRHLSGALMGMPVACSVYTGAPLVLPACSIRVTAEQMLAQCKRGMTVDQCLQYLAGGDR